MSGTHFGGVVYSMGVPLLGGEGILTQGDSYFLDPVNGNDSNNGKSVDKAKKTLLAAYDATTAAQNDVIYYLASTTAGSTTVSATLTWSKNQVHLIGVCAPTLIAKRARIMQAYGTTAVSPMIDITATGCIFKNLYFFQGVADATSLIDIRVTGARNYFENVHFAGIGDATQDASGGCSLSLDGAAENTFVNCAIGLDTQTTRTSNTTELLVDTSSSRNAFIDCILYAWISGATHTLVKIADTAGVDRWLWFKRCLFLSESANNALAMTAAIDTVSAAVSSYIILQDCTAVGITAWYDTASGKLYANMASPTASAAGGLATSI